MDPRFVESGATHYVSPITGETAAKVVKASPGKLFYIRVANVQNVARFAHVYDNASAASGTPLCPPLVLAANGERELQLITPMPYINGLTIASSTVQTSVSGGGTDLQIHAIFK